MQKIPSVKMSEHIGESVQRSAMEGGDAVPTSHARNIIGTPPMFSYPTRQTPDPEAAAPSNGIAAAAEEKTGAVIDPAKVKAAAELRSKEAEVERKAEQAANPIPAPPAKK